MDKWPFKIDSLGWTGGKTAQTPNTFWTIKLLGDLKPEGTYLLAKVTG